MGTVVVDISTSLDGFVAGPNPSLERERVIDSPAATHLRYRVVKP